MKRGVPTTAPTRVSGAEQAARRARLRRRPRAPTGPARARAHAARPLARRLRGRGRAGDVTVASGRSARRPRVARRRRAARSADRRRAVDACGGARQAEVEHAHAPVVADHDVVGLEVAVHQPGAVRGGQPFAGGEEDVEDLARAARLRLEPLRAASAPSTNSMAMNTSPPNVPTSWTAITLGCDSRASACASRSRRSRCAPAVVLVGAQQLERDRAIELRDRRPCRRRPCRPRRAGSRSR